MALGNHGLAASILDYNRILSFSWSPFGSHGGRNGKHTQAFFFPLFFLRPELPSVLSTNSETGFLKNKSCLQWGLVLSSNMLRKLYFGVIPENQYVASLGQRPMATLRSSTAHGGQGTVMPGVSQCRFYRLTNFFAAPSRSKIKYECSDTGLLRRLSGLLKYAAFLFFLRVRVLLCKRILLGIVFYGKKKKKKNSRQLLVGSRINRA